MQTSTSLGLPADGNSPSGIDDLHEELRRLQALLGPSEDSYRKLQLDLLGARDAAIAAEAKVGNLRGQIVALTSLNARTEADAVSLLRQVYYRLFTERQRHLLQPMVSLARRTARLVRR
jgi:predicted  nucleic acid-binding Zn-ribbon protein